MWVILVQNNTSGSRSNFLTVEDLVNADFTLNFNFIRNEISDGMWIILLL